MSDRDEMLALADEYERSLNRMRGSCYQEYQGSIRRHELVIKALRSTASTGPDVAVKPLEWTECRSMWFQASVCPRYEINPAVPSGYRLTYAGLRIDAPAEGCAFETVDAAKAAAQADFEQRIRSAITATVGTAKPGYQAGFEACREALKAALPILREYDFPGAHPHRKAVYKQAEAAIAALPAPATASAGWQDIETAPKDTPIWAWGDNWHWREGSIGFLHSDYIGHKGVVCFGGRAGPPFSIGSENAPSHWMPLPAAPTKRSAT